MNNRNTAEYRRSAGHKSYRHMSRNRVGYASGERNGMAKLSNHETDLIADLHDSYSGDLNRIDEQIEALKAERREIKQRMRRSVIADMFGISDMKKPSLT